MKKIKLYTNGINEFSVYLNVCNLSIGCNEINFQSATFKELVLYHIDVMRKNLQMKYLQMMHKGKAKITVSFSRAELLTCSFLFKHVAVSHYMASIEYNLLEGLEIKKLN